jgi:hypothetical protein
MSTPGRIAILLVAASCLPAGGCTHACTDIGGADGLYVRIDVTGGKLPPGDYTFVARIGKDEVTAFGTMLSEGAFQNGASESIIDGKHLVLSGAVYGDSGGISVQFREGRGPTMVTLGVRYGGATLVEQSYSPTYAPVFPNGEDCGPELQQAQGSLVIAAP